MLTEDFIGRIAIVIIMTILVIFTGATLVTQLQQSSHASLLAVLTQTASTIFLGLQLLMTISRIPPKGTARGIGPRVASVGGAFVMLAAMLLTPAFDNEIAQILALCLIFGGTVGSIFCLYWLGRSFSIMATARRLVTTGPYSVVRHPLYVCEAGFVLGIVISHLSVTIIVIGVLQFILQYNRAKNEEAILRQTFPEYDEYARRVPMLVPRFFMSSSRRPVRSR
ncbi:sodium:proton antiporter [Mesorhizobium loti]|uniref:Sodium:proton antiporter n=1 Tax=Rhizobium loti TaxID=381 RepID=A0A101KRM8_RHILI|nr:sodium:proton antiporter [Mesorhizobium loti]